MARDINNPSTQRKIQTHTHTQIEWPENTHLVESSTQREWQKKKATLGSENEREKESGRKERSGSKNANKGKNALVARKDAKKANEIERESFFKIF